LSKNTLAYKFHCPDIFLHMCIFGWKYSLIKSFFCPEEFHYKFLRREELRNKLLCSEKFLHVSFRLHLRYDFHCPEILYLWPENSLKKSFWHICFFVQKKRPDKKYLDRNEIEFLKLYKSYPVHINFD
jgi:hypothetical protein